MCIRDSFYIQASRIYRKDIECSLFKKTEQFSKSYMGISLYNVAVILNISARLDIFVNGKEICNFRYSIQ